MLETQSTTSESETTEPTEITEPKEQQRSSFYDLPLLPEVQNAASKAGYETPSAIQLEIIPHMIEGRDVLAQSQTGTGKTAAFAMPILSRIEIRRGKPQVLVLTPTRELAIQVSESFEKYAICQPGFEVATIYGGQGYDVQLRKLRKGVQVVVGTPGRVIDHIKRGTLDLSGIQCLVLDEGDEMLNMGFLEDVQFVLDQMPKERQIALFSATLPQPIREIAKQYLNDPVKITIKSRTMTADSIRQRALFISPRDKLETLKRILEAEDTDGVIVFTKTKESTVVVAEKLARSGLLAVALNGDMPQRARERTIERLKAGHLNILVATDVAARGLDVTRVSHVFNYDLPHDSQAYIHRIGRTGRAGRKGEAIIFLTGSQRGKLRMIERATRQSIEVVEPPSADVINETRIKRFSKQIADTIANDKAAFEMTLFKEMLVKFAEESGHPLEVIAAALAHIGQNGRPFKMRDLPKRGDQFNDRYEKRDHQGQVNGSRHGEGKKKGRPDRKSGPPADGMIRYRIQVGWRDGVKPGNIVGAIANEAGIDGQYIGPIDINHGYSTIDLPEGMPGEIFRTLQRTRVAGQQLKISIDGEKPERKRYSDSRNREDRNSNGHSSERNSGNSKRVGNDGGKTRSGGKFGSKPGGKTGGKRPTKSFIRAGKKSKNGKRKKQKSGA